MTTGVRLCTWNAAECVLARVNEHAELMCVCVCVCVCVCACVCRQKYKSAEVFGSPTKRAMDPIT